MWNYVEFEKAVVNYFEKKDWNKMYDDGTFLIKRYNSEFPIKSKRSNLINDHNFFERIVDIFLKSGLKRKTLNSMKNEQDDTDLVIAGFQIIGKMKDNASIPCESWYSFQPVVRLNQLYECGNQEGFISSFVNICVIETDTSILKFLDRVDWWITVLSKVSLHSSGVKLKLKKKTTLDGGVGIEFQYKNLEIGQANLYEIKSENKHYFISDFGFGYERILWALNGGKKFFLPLFDKYDIDHNNIVECDKMRTAVLMIMSGIKPTASGVGKHIKKLILLATHISWEKNYSLRIKRYYNYYKKFISPQFSYEQVREIYEKEFDNLFLGSLSKRKNKKEKSKDFFEEYEKMFPIK